MATGPPRQEKNNVTPSEKIDLTPTGLLMEGGYTFKPRSLGNAGSMSTMAINRQLMNKV